MCDLRIIVISRRMLRCLSLLALVLAVGLTVRLLGDNRQVAAWVSAGMSGINSGDGGLPPVIYAGDERNNAVSLLFLADETVESACVGKILAVLAENKAEATFFISQGLAENKPEVLLAITAGGHQLGNYGVDGIDPDNMDIEQNRAAIQETGRWIEAACGEEPLVYLAAYGGNGDEVRRAAAESGLMFITGGIDGGSWSNDSVENMLTEVLSKVKAGSFVVLSPDEMTLSGLDTLLKELAGLGLTMLSVGDNIVWTAGDGEYAAEGRQ